MPMFFFDCQVPLFHRDLTLARSTSRTMPEIKNKSLRLFEVQAPFALGPVSRELLNFGASCLNLN